MKIVFFVGEFSEGGAERVISILVNQMVERGFCVEIMKYFKSENFYKTNEKIKISSIEENTNTTNIIKNVLWLRKFAKKNSDVFISFLAPFNILASLALFGTKVPLIVADRNDPSKIPTNAVLRVVRNFLYRFADAVVLQTTNNKNYFDSTVKRKGVVIPNPINMDDYLGYANKQKKEDIIVSVGRLQPQKNQKMLIDVFNSIKDRYPELKLVIYGEGSYRSELEKHISELKLTDKVLLPGKEKDIFNKISSAKAFVMTSNYEGMSNALIEAMCLGLPVISTKVSGTEDLIMNGENGIVIELNDAAALEDSLTKILDDSEYSSKLADNAVNIYNTLKTDVITDRWIDLIDKVSQ